MTVHSYQLRWGIEQRLEFIEFRLFWEGAINRSDLVKNFGVSVPQASNDLGRYQKIAPHNIVYDKSRKCYVTGPEFGPVLTQPDARKFLAQLTDALSDDAVDAQRWLSDPPPADFLPLPQRNVDVEVLRAVLNAVSDRASLDIDYQSMAEARPAPTRRWITPHAFANDAIRWHVRAYCHVDHKFKDFLLARILRIHNKGSPGASPGDDRIWHEHLTLVLVPNPALSELQKRVIARDFEMTGNRLEIPVRKALLYYFARRFRLDLLHHADQPYESPVLVHNRAEFDAALAEASE